MNGEQAMGRPGIIESLETQTVLDGSEHFLHMQHDTHQGHAMQFPNDSPIFPGRNVKLQPAIAGEGRFSREWYLGVGKGQAEGEGLFVVRLRATRTNFGNVDSMDVATPDSGGDYLPAAPDEAEQSAYAIAIIAQHNAQPEPDTPLPEIPQQRTGSHEAESPESRRRMSWRGIISQIVNR